MEEGATVDVALPVRFPPPALIDSIALPQVFIEKLESALPCQFGGGFVIARCRVVVEAVLFALVHVQRIQLVVGLERCFIVRDACVDALVIAGVMQQ
jgi:hypothetical protein